MAQMSARWNPVADERAVVLSACGRARFTVLTPRMIRMEWSPSGRFENRASQAFVNRRVDVPPFHVERAGKTTRIVTDRVGLSFVSDGKAFHAGNLSVRFGVAERAATWHPGMDASGNLGGTTRTLDGVDGSCEIEPGLVSRDGWAVVDDSKRLVFEPPDFAARVAPSREPRHPALSEWDWMVAREASENLDWYFLGYGHDYAEALRDYTKMAGPVPLPPRYVFGSWWSRYWAYSDQDLKNLVNEFREHDVPLDVLVIDMDWHDGPWTGYTWNKKYFPDPEGFLRWTDQHGLQITLNLHPADGVAKREAAFPAMCRALGIDPAGTEHVPFDCTSRAYMQAYFRELHYPLEKMGVDFWWMDWQQGTKTATPGLDPLWWLNHLHWVDLEQRQRSEFDPGNVRRGRRPLVFSRWGGLGNHRYPIGFSGDTYSTWRSLAWQPEFTSVAGNVGYFYWSHDIGGHQPGPVEPELYARWIQYGVLSPVLRTHTSKNPQGERRIWASPEREFKAMREAFVLRYKMLPYIYTASRRGYDEAVPLCRPLYHAWPEMDEAYEARGQYLFGDDMMVSPVVTAGDRTSRAAAVNVWIPPGTWTHWYSGEEFEGPRRLEMLVPLEEMPIFVRGGAIVPQAPAMRWSSERPLDHVTLVVWPGADGLGGCGRLYEDDGESGGYEHGACAWTGFSQRRVGEVVRVRIEPASGCFDGMVEERSWEVRLVDRWPARAVRVGGRELGRIGADAPVGAEGWYYDQAKLTNVVRLSRASVREAREVDVVLDGADESPLRRGLHGRLKLLETLGTLLGSHAPGRLRDASSGALRDAMIVSRGRGMDEAFGAESRWALACEVAACGADEALRGEAICRLLDVTCGMTIASDPAAAGRVRTKVEARMLGGSAPREVAATVSATPTRAWAAVSREVGGDTRRIVEEASWQTQTPLQMTSLRASLSLARGGESVGVAFEQSVLPSINGWWVVGPFPCPIKGAMKTVFAPEQRADLGATYEVAGRAPVSWKRAQRVIRPGDDPAAEYVVDLHAMFGERLDDAVAYAMTTLHAERDMDVVLALGSDDGAAVWINGEKVHENDVMRGYGSKQDFVPIRLRRGDNTVLIKITQAQGAWCFGAHVQTRDGLPAEGVSVRME